MEVFGEVRLINQTLEILEVEFNVLLNDSLFMPCFVSG